MNVISFLVNHNMYKEADGSSLLVNIFVVLAIGMVLRDGHYYNSLDFHWQKLLRYEHHKINYEISLQKGVIPFGLRIKKKPAFVPVTTDFHEKWDTILHDAGHKLVELLFHESKQVISRLEHEFEEKLIVSRDKGEERRLKSDFAKRHAVYKKELESRRRNKWVKFQSGRRPRLRTIIRNNYGVTTPYHTQVRHRKGGRLETFKKFTSEAGADNVRVDLAPAITPIDTHNVISEVIYTESDPGRLSEDEGLVELLAGLDDTSDVSNVSAHLVSVNAAEHITVQGDTVNELATGADTLMPTDLTLLNATSYVTAVENDSIQSSEDHRLAEQLVGLGDDTSNVPIISRSPQPSYGTVRFAGQMLVNNELPVHIEILAPMEIDPVQPSEDTRSSDLPPDLDDTSILSNVATNLEETSSSTRCTGRFVSNNVFVIGTKTLTSDEISLLEKGLGFCPTPYKINKYELEQDFEEFSRLMRCKWFFRNSINNNKLEYPDFQAKSNWDPPCNFHNLETFLSMVKKEVLEIDAMGNNYPNLNKGELVALKCLTDAKDIVTKPADKGSAIIVWDKTVYLE